MKKTIRSPRKLAIPKAALRPVADAELVPVAGGRIKYIHAPHDPHSRMEY